MRSRGPGSRGRRGIAVAAVAALAGALACYGGAADAVPRPTISQVQAEVNSLQAKIDKIGQQYIQVSARVSAAHRCSSSWPKTSRPRPPSCWLGRDR